MPNRMISLERNTNETQIDLTLDLDGTGRYEVDTGCGFLNHMLELFARHGRFDLVLTCHGDVQVDYHHTTEDVGNHERADRFASQKPDNRLAKERERKSWNAPPGQKVAEKTQISARGYG